MPTEQLSRNKPTATERERAMEITKPLTPRSEMRRSAYGALGISLANLNSEGRCVQGKCFYALGHKGPHAGGN
jgi:hypothetical protein